MIYPVDIATQRLDNRGLYSSPSESVAVFVKRRVFTCGGFSVSPAHSLPLTSSRLQDKKAHREKLRENLGRAGERRKSGACKGRFSLATESGVVIRSVELVI